MNRSPVPILFAAGVLLASVSTVQSQVIELRATLNAQQEVPATTSPATGSAIMLYDVAANTFDLVVSIDGMSNPATASHLHEAAAGANGGVVTNLGGEAAYTRSGSSLRATFRNLTHGGDQLRLIQGGAYFNIHSAQFPGGEIRGQLMPQPVRLYANLDVAQEQAAFPAVNLSGLQNFGGVLLVYEPADNRISLRASLFNFRNTFTNSHIHEGAPGVSGPVRTSLGNNANAGGYSSANGLISGRHEHLAFVGDPLVLLAGRMYLNYHSATFTGGELRGQIRVSSESPGTRLVNLAVRGFVGPGEQTLIGGFVVTGTEPVKVLAVAKGPSLTAFDVANALANPRLALFDSGGREIASNDDVGTVAAGSELAGLQGAPRHNLESALVVVLPPGNYTAQVTAATGTGISLLEVFDVR